MTDVPVVTSADSERDQRRAAAALAARGRARRRPAAGLGRRLARRCSPSSSGALRTGVVPVVLDPGLPAAERAALAEDADPALDLGDDPGAAARATTRPSSPTCRWPGRCTTRPGRRDGARACGPASSPRTTPGALAAEEIELWGFEPADRHLVLSPLHHSAPLRFAIHTLLAGGEVLLPGPFDAARAAAVDHRAPADDDVLRAHPPAAAARRARTSTGRRSAGSCTPARPAPRR